MGPQGMGPQGMGGPQRGWAPFFQQGAPAQN
jgi:hypothetical protein